MSSQPSIDIAGPNKAIATGLSPLHKIIVGIDYGTTFSGIICGISTMQNSDELRILPLHAENENGQRKIPSRFAYAKENTILKKNAWGSEVGPRHTSCSWTKLLLDKNAVFGEDDDIISKLVIDDGMMHLPSHRDCKGVCEDFLQKLYVSFSGYAERTLGKDTFRMSPIDCWITLPAIWSDEAKHATLNAAKRAGFATNPMDQIHTIAEPEAAAIATLKELAAPGTLNAVQRGDNVLICDCGGGTVDITTYTVTSVEPKLTFEELCIGIGGKCGSTYIDRHLHALLSDRFGDAFESIPYSRKGPGSALMDNWELLKKRFGGNIEDSGTFELGPLYLDLPSSHHYDRVENLIFLSLEDMKSVFDPIVDRVIKLVQKQVVQAEHQRRAKIHRITLVGGMGASKYLHDRLLSWCASNGKLSFYALDLAVLRGAGIRALEELAPRIKYVRRHYGFRISRVFRELLDEEKYAYIDDYSNQKYCKGRAGDEITAGSMIELYSCEGDQQPDRMDDPRVKSVGKIPYNFPSDFSFGLNSKSRFNQRLDKMVHEFHFQIQVIFGDRGANLKFRLAVGGRVVSDTTIEFPDH
ncbi:hsp70 protein-like protein [Botrytis cinerea]